MKRGAKLLLAVLGIVGFIAAINHMIFKMASKRITQKKERFFAWKFGNVRYVTYGEGRPLLLVHGAYPGASLLEWEKTIENFSKKYKVYAVELLGYGYSDKPAISYSSYLYASLINDFIKNIIKEKCFCIGSGHGGSFAAAAANLSPSNFKKILLINPVGIGETAMQPTEYDSLIRSFFELPIIGTAIYNFITSRCKTAQFLDNFGYANQVNSSSVNRCYYPAHFGGSGGKYPISALKTKLFNMDLTRFMKNIELKIPVCVFWGEDNEPNNLENMKALEKNCNKAEYAVFPHSKLFLHEEQPNLFYSEAKRFLEE